MIFLQDCTTCSAWCYSPIYEDIQFFLFQNNFIFCIYDALTLVQVIMNYQLHCFLGKKTHFFGAWKLNPVKFGAQVDLLIFWRSREVVSCGWPTTKTYCTTFWMSEDTGCNMHLIGMHYSCPFTLLKSCGTKYIFAKTYPSAMKTVLQLGACHTTDPNLSSVCVSHTLGHGK